MVDIADFGAVAVATAAEAVGETRRLSVVRVIGSHVAAMTSVVRLHLSSAVNRALIARTALLRTPSNKRVAI